MIEGQAVHLHQIAHAQVGVEKQPQQAERRTHGQHARERTLERIQSRLERARDPALFGALLNLRLVWVFFGPGLGL